MSLRQINANLWVLELDLGIFDVRSALVVGQERALVWDTLSHPRDMTPYLPIIKNKGLIVIYSHADWDHIWGTGGLIGPPAAIISHTLCHERFQLEVPETLCQKQCSEPGLWDDVQLLPPTIAFKDELLIDLGGLSVELHHLPGHTEDCLVAILPELGVALLGDTIESPFPVVPVESRLPEWIAHLRRWEQDKRISIVIPSHGPIGERQLITQTIDYLDRLHTGQYISVSDQLTDFYRATHQSNLLVAR